MLNLRDDGEVRGHVHTHTQVKQADELEEILTRKFTSFLEQRAEVRLNRPTRSLLVAALSTAAVPEELWAWEAQGGRVRASSVPST